MRDETACGHRCAEELRCQARNTVEIGIGRRIEDSGAIKSGEAHLLRQGSGHKFKGWPRRQAGIWNRPTERGQSSGIITQTDRHIGFAGLSGNLRKDKGYATPVSPETSVKADNRLAPACLAVKLSARNSATLPARTGT